MNIKEAWSILQDHLPEAAGYEPCEYEEMKEVIAEYEEAWRIVNEELRRH